MSNREIAEMMERQLDLALSPVTIRFVSRQGGVPNEGRPERPLRSFCHAVMIASRGNSLVILQEDILCQYGAATLGFRDYTGQMLSGKMQYGEGAFGNLEGAQKAVTGGHRLEAGSTKAIVLYPLSQAEEDYDILLIPVSPWQAMFICMADEYQTGSTTEVLMKASGLQAFCRDCTVYPLLTGEINFSVVAVGDRIKSGLDPEYMLVGIPRVRLSEIVRNLEIMESKLITKYKSSRL
jgi:uncharacterized protein (DUF169 family)